jgi:hypothetical protein
VGALDIRATSGFDFIEKDTVTEEKKCASIGGVFRAKQLAEVAKACNQSLKVDLLMEPVPERFIQEIRNAINDDIPPIVAFDAEGGDPVENWGGQHSHWGVVIG